jgi:catechol 2,3-dioxygenase
MSMVSHIGHVGLQVTDLGRSVDFAERVLGLREVTRDGTTSYLTCNERHHELVLVQGPQTACEHLAFEVYTRDALDELREDLRRLGVSVVADGPQERGVRDAVRFLAPGGFVVEVFHGIALDQPAHYDTAGARPRKFEHITLKSSRKDELEAFLGDVLGLRLSDRAGDAISWWRASDEHHGVSVIAADADLLHHYAWQIDGWTAIKTTGDHLMHHGRGFLWGPGHHGIGDNYFCYFLDDDGVIVEYSADIQRVEDEARYEPRIWPDEPLSVNRWGNPPPPQAFLAGGVPLTGRPAEVLS